MKESVVPYQGRVAAIPTRDHLRWPLRGVAAALANLEIIEMELALDLVNSLTHVLGAAVNAVRGGDGVIDVHHAGLMVGIQLASDTLAVEVSKRCLQDGYIAASHARHASALSPFVTIVEGISDVTRSIKTNLPSR